MSPTARPGANEIGSRLRALRVEAGLTQAALASQLGTTQSAIARMERGLQRTTLETVDRFAAALGCEVAVTIERRSA